MAATALDKSQFSFSHVLLAEASNRSLHPRASVHELQAILRPINASDSQADSHVAHWWEAQCLHYGLRPSKAKSVAKVRLLEALNNGKLVVSKEMEKLEADLKKQWQKKEREERKRKAGDDDDHDAVVTGSQVKKTKATTEKKMKSVVAAASVPKPSTSTKAQPQASKTASTKRKTPKATVSFSSSTSKDAAGLPTRTATQMSSPTTKPPRTKQIAKRGGGFMPQGCVSTIKHEEPQTSPTTNHPRPKQTARRSGGWLPHGHAPAIEREESKKVVPTNHPRTKQTARRTGGFLGGRYNKIGDYHDNNNKNDDGDDDDDDDENLNYYNDDDDDDDDDDGSTPGSQPLGLLNGTYKINCPALEQWDWTSDDFSLILTLDGQSIWGAYNFGMFEGILRLPTRPYASGSERHEFTWRGRENGEGEMSFGPGNEGWMQFLGGGRIGGMINCYGEAEFEGRRISGNETMSERNARSMRDEWDGYNQREYDWANRARWGGSSFY